MTGTDFDTAKAFYDSHRRIVSFTKYSFDVSTAIGTLITVRFVSAFACRRSGPDLFVVTLRFKRVY